MNSLYLRMHNETTVDSDEIVSDDFNCDWVVLDEQLNLVSEGTGSIHGLMAEVETTTGSATFSRTVLFLSDAMTLFVRTEVQGKTASQMIKALPYTVESYVSTDIEEMHVARGAVRRGEPVDCVVTENAQLARTLDKFSECGLDLTHCSTIGMQVPVEEDAVGAFADSKNFWVRTADQLAVMDADAFAESIDFIFQSATDEDPQIHLKTFAPSHDVLNSVQTPSSVEVEEIEVSLLTNVAQQFDAEATINILQGTFSASDQSFLDKQQWMTTGSVVLASLLIYIGTVAGQGIWADLRVDALETQAKELYESIYGASPGIRDPASRMRVRLNSAQGESGSFEILLSEFSRVVDRTGPNTIIHNINYRDSQQTLTTELKLSSFEALDRFEKAVDQESVAVKIDSVEQDGLGVRAKLTLTLQQ